MTLDAPAPTMISDFEVLRGKHILLQFFTSNDITAEYVGWLNDPEVVRFSNQRFRQHSFQSCQEYLASFTGSANRFVKIIRSADRLTVGTMTAYVAVPHCTVDMGIMVGNRSCWGYGLGQDAWDTLLGWLIAQPQIRKVTAGAMRANAGMIRIMERAGMNHEATRCAQELLDGVPQDILYFAKFSGR